MESSLTEGKMETIRKKLDMLRTSLNESEARADAAEKELEAAKQRNERVRIFAIFFTSIRC